MRGEASPKKRWSISSIDFSKWSAMTKSCMADQDSGWRSARQSSKHTKGKSLSKASWTKEANSGSDCRYEAPDLVCSLFHASYFELLNLKCFNRLTCRA